MTRKDAVWMQDSIFFFHTATHLAQVYLNDLVVFTVLVWDQVVFELIGQGRNLWREGELEVSRSRSGRGEQKQ